MFSVSIIIPVYNVQNYIGRCLDSIFSQESDRVKLECILINDCTQDGSMDIVSEKLKGYKGNISFILKTHSQNQGLSAARNTGINAAHGEYVLFVDSDDHFEEGAIDYMVSCLEKTGCGEDVDIVMANSFVCNNQKPAMALDDNGEELLDNKNEKALRDLMTRRLFHTVWNKLIRKDLIVNYSLWFEDGIIDEDLLWSYLVFLNAKKVLVLPRVTYIYEDNPSSILNTSSPKISLVIRSRIIICDKILNSPPRLVCLEYYMYLYYIFIRGLDLSEHQNHKDGELQNNLVAIRKRLLHEVKEKQFYLLYLFFLTSKMPFYYVFSIKLCRRYFDNIASCILKISKFFTEF